MNTADDVNAVAVALVAGVALIQARRHKGAPPGPVTTATILWLLGRLSSHAARREARAINEEE